MKQLHTLQLALLKKLLYSPGLTYSALRPDTSIENNKLSFHLDKLLEANYIQKDEASGLYMLTAAGKEYANTMDTGELFVKKQAKIGVIMCTTREESDGTWSVLINTRRKQPFYGKQGFGTGKIDRGEGPEQTAERELKEEANLVGTAKIVKLFHYLEHHNQTKDLIEDKFLFLCNIHNPTGELQANIEGDWKRVHETDLEKEVTNPYRSIEETRSVFETAKYFDGTMSYSEVSWYSEGF